MEREQHRQIRKALVKQEIAGIRHGERCFISGITLGTIIGALIMRLLS